MSLVAFDSVRVEDLKEQKERLSAKKSFESFDSSDSECSLEGGFPWWYPCRDEWYIEEIVGGYESGLNLNKGRSRYCRVPMDYVSSVERRPILEMTFPTQKVPKWTEPFTRYEKAFKTWDRIVIEGLHADILPRVLHRITIWDSDGIPISFTKPPHTAVAKLDTYFITGKASVLKASPPALGCGGCRNVFNAEGVMIRHRHTSACGFVFSSVTENDVICIYQNISEGAATAALLAAMMAAVSAAATHIPENDTDFDESSSSCSSDTDGSEDWSDDEAWPSSVHLSQQEMLDFPELLGGL
eukprot:TRINITY_DN11742_c0_g1_i1.p1 TRINITY_DN11742_c0_g1~~TRINITY_DN11742_c0_g1_i1.p1  ORF type:complete len:322 (+),score=57.84 TRINITY_DN11742_c0_g1_i1:71-967(+)